MTSFVLDASAVLAYLHREPGADVVQRLTSEPSAITTVNLIEVVAKRIEHGGTALEVMESVGLLRIDVRPFGADEAVRAAALLATHRTSNLSLADSACIAAADLSGATVLTADRAWAELNLGVEVQLIR